LIGRGEEKETKIIMKRKLHGLKEALVTPERDKSYNRYYPKKVVMAKQPQTSSSTSTTSNQPKYDDSTNTARSSKAGAPSYCSCLMSWFRKQPDVVREGQAEKDKAVASPPRPKKITPKTKKILVLDMDETLVHVSASHFIGYDLFFEFTDPDTKKKLGMYAIFRPYLRLFLKTLSEHYKLVIFTAGTQPVDTFPNLVCRCADRCIRSKQICFGETLQAPLQ